jgi:hypothetical protein
MHAFSSPRFSSRSISGIRIKRCTSSFLVRAGESLNDDDKSEPTDTVDEKTTLIIEEDVAKNDLTKKDDPFGVVRLRGTAVLSLVGLAILVNDASKFTPFSVRSLH